MMRGHRGLLGVVAMLAAFGLEGPPPPEPEIDLAEVAKVLDLLAAAGIASPDVLESAGSPARFIVTARKVLAAQGFLASFGEPGITDVGRLLAPLRQVERDIAADLDLGTTRAGITTADIESDEAYLARARASMPQRATTGAVGQEATGDALTPAMIRRAVAVLEENGLPKDADGMYRVPGAPPAEPARFPSIPQIMGDQHPAMTSRPRGPVDFNWAGEESRARRTIHRPTGNDIAAAERLEAVLHPSGKCTCGGGGTGDCDWCVMDQRRAAREERPAKRDDQAADRKARARKKARRGW